MKSKRSKLLKILSVIGIFAVSAAVPITLVSKYVIFTKTSSSNGNVDDNSGNNNGNDNSNPNDNNGNNDGGNDSNNNNTTPQDGSIVPRLKSSINLSGTVDKIYNSQNASETNNLIAEEIKTNLEQAFDNSTELENVNDLNITVNGNFADTSSWGGNPYDGTNGWSGSTTGNEILYSTSLNQLNISSLNDLKHQLTDAKIKEILRSSDSSKLNESAEYTVKNKLGFTNNNLVHVNIMEILGSGVRNFDLQIPISSINFNVSNMSISVSGTDVQTTNATTNFNYNIAINNTESNTPQPTSTPKASSSEVTNADKILVKLGYADVGTNNSIVLNQELLQEEFGIYNVEFSNAKIAPNTSTNRQVGSYKITLDATPIANKGFIWQDGTTSTKSVSFDVNVDIGEISPALNTTLNLTGPLSKIYDVEGTSGSRKSTNTLIAEDIKANLDTYFSNGNDLKTVENLSVSASGSFPTTSSWTGTEYSTWSTSVQYSAVYGQSLGQINISSLNDLKTKWNSQGIYNVLLGSGLRFSDSTFTVQNLLGFTGGDLLHMNIFVNSGYTANFTVDLQIPASNINLTVPTLRVTANGSNVASLQVDTTNFTYNIGIKDTVDFVKPTTGVTALAPANKTNVNEALVSLGFATRNTSSNPYTYTLDSEKISAALGVFNCTFEGISITEDESNPNNYTIVLKASPNANYNWESGSSDPKELSFKVDLASS
ncbi:signal-peptide-less P35 lipoprotein homolog [Malacoplasma penetrans HF-2]|uniref:Signal-peptide-less P35 lipoprotein homolog n=1 Tax=Malacoplasma penetrans (strain HF-2) TaxID=272633 RepID=Q8EV63_MALP2|nr:P35 family lipoprotein [Malacoplasma penetrans]BAC44497.1 signal-peptide-less P35 lipoprotein homolog [Malacoplasma penetrans HF-2]